MRLRSQILVVLIPLLLVLGLPLAVWLDLKALSEAQLARQSTDMARIIDAVRNFYATDVVARVLSAPEHVTASHLYRTTQGAIPIPATFSLELGKLVGTQGGSIAYRFISDYPFAGREPHLLDAFEKQSLAALRKDPADIRSEVSGTLFDRQVRLVTPVVMAQTCVDCHNSHPDSPRKDWKRGDVRAIQTVAIHQRVEANILAFRSLLGYLVALVAAALGFIVLQRRQRMRLANLNRELSGTNEFLAAISMKIAKYISPQIYRSIFSGERDVAIATERKKLTIFFSDIQDFTSTTEQMQPEDLTRALNEYFTAMAAIAHTHGGTVDKFIGDAVLVFFGDPETRGVTEDARACVRMAMDMQRRIVELGETWRARGVARPFRARMGINTGYCNVGNFGSDERMDYTIIGAEANLAARLQQAAEPGEIVMSYETYVHVRDLIDAREMPPIAMKGINREVIPYAFAAPITPREVKGLDAKFTGFDLTLDPAQLDATSRAAAKDVLIEAMRRLEQPPDKTGEPRQS
jgi:adenylate cyclase